MSDVRIAKVGDVIAHGETIPANVVRFTDRDRRVGEFWRRSGVDPSRYAYFADGTYGNAAPPDFIRSMPRWWPLTVIEVDPEPQPATQPATSPACWKCGSAEGRIVDRGAGSYADGRLRYMHAYGSCESKGEVTEQVAQMFDLEWPRPEPQPAEAEDDVHYYVSELRPGVTFCGILVEDDDNLLTASEPGKATCDTCRAEADEDAFMRQPAEDHEVPTFLDGFHAANNCEWGAGCAQHRFDKPQPAVPGPLVLTLPEVPAGAVALIGVATGLRYENNGTRAYPWRNRAGVSGSLGVVLEHEPQGVTVEFAPPREPRTWEPLGHAEPGLKVTGASGNVYTFSTDSPTTGTMTHVDRIGDVFFGCWMTLGTLREVDGPLTEVLT